MVMMRERARIKRHACVAKHLSSEVGYPSFGRSEVGHSSFGRSEVGNKRMRSPKPCPESAKDCFVRGGLAY